MSRQTISKYLQACYPALWIKSYEEDRVVKELSSIANGKYGLKVWSCTKGWIDTESKAEVDDFDADMLKMPDGCLNYIEEDTEEMCIYVIQNFHFYLENNAELIQRIKDLIPVCKRKAKFMIFVSCQLVLPMEIEKEITVVDFDFPEVEELRDVLGNVLGSVEAKFEILDEKLILESALGLTSSEAENAYSLAVVECMKDTGQKEGVRVLGEKAMRIIQREKSNIIKKTGMLEYIPPTFSLDDIGGLGNLKSWLAQRKRAFSPQAREFGLPSPRGIMLVGPPGNGKSLTAKVVSASWNIPLLRFNIGQVFGSLVGQSEEQMRKALKTAEAISPCILWIDEIDKGLSGMGSASTDSGVSKRVFGELLTWMQEKTKAVFVFATANNVSALPAEFLRKGRFDELFWCDLPNQEDRKEIFSIHISRRNRNPEDFDLETLANKSDGFGGAEIEEAVVSGLYAAFAEERDLKTEDILLAVSESTPISKTMEEDIKVLRKWGENRARNASVSKAETKKKQLQEVSEDTPVRRIV